MPNGNSGHNITFIADLFLRVGVWISRCEDSDKSVDSEEAEKAALLQSLSRVEKISPYPVVKQAAKRARESYPNFVFEGHPDAIIEDAKKAIALLKQSQDEDLVVNFSKALRYVGFSVARAYREELDHHEEEFLLEGLLNKLCGDLNEISDPDEFKNQNISPAEDSALTLLAEALRP